MPRIGQAHPVDKAWRERVERALAERGWSRADLAREVRCSRSVITQILNGTVNQSPYVVEIHAALGWTPPQPPIASTETEEILRAWELLDTSSRARLLERAAALLEVERAKTEREKKS
jgi:transcriptional regulator with XRE-family HTH domain